MDSVEAETHLNKLERMINDGEQSATSMGIEVEWEYRPLREGGYFRRKKAWGVAKYRDTLTGRELERKQALEILQKPIEERKSSADLTNIGYCASCGCIGVGQKERETWGQIKICAGYRVWKDQTGKETNRIPCFEWRDICYKCCVKIIKGGK